ncbi:MAG: IS256 family transposase [Elusimicrobiota bacterium]
MNGTKVVAVRQSKSALQVPMGRDALTEALRGRIRGFLNDLLSEEADAFLGAGSYQRSDSRRGYRHGSVRREITTSFGKTPFDRPRAKLFAEDGHLAEWRSTMLPRYSRRCRDVDAALLGLYFGGVNTRKVKQAIRPLLKGSPLSSSTISRLIVKIEGYFQAWQCRSLVEEDIRYLYLDGIYVRVRCGRKVSKLPMLVAVGVRATGEKILLAMETRGEESEEAWKGMLQGLADRGLKRPLLAIVDGNRGLANALDSVWPKMDRQRCIIHKLRNLQSHAPRRLYDELKEDFHRIVYADDMASGKEFYDRFLRKWKKQWTPVARSLEEAGPELLAFYRYPQSQWKSLRTTNAVERLNEEFRRRMKTQGSFPSESSVLVVLFGLVASGMVRLRKIPGYYDMPPRSPEALERSV